MLEVALDGSIDEFIKFYEQVSRREQELPEEIMMQLNKTAMNIVSIARKARAEKTILARDESQPLGEDTGISTEDFSSTRENLSRATDNLPFLDRSITRNHHYLTQKSPMSGGGPAPISQRLLSACLMRAIALLQLANFSAVALTPAMLLPLQLDRAEGLLERAAYRLSGHPNSFLVDCQYGNGLNASLPKMMRLIEGNLNSLKPRSSPPDLERLQFGRTRTMLHTSIADLQGEWLEALDVEEYLEQRGIFVRIGSPSDVMSLSALTGDGSLPEPDALDLPRPRGPRLATLEDVPNLQKEGSINQGLGMPENHFYSSDDHAERGGKSTSRVAIPEHDFTIFGRIFREGQSIPTGRSSFAASGWYPDTGGVPADGAIPSEQTQEGLRITIDLDKLIRGLADKAVCLGPCPGIRRIHVDEAIRASVSHL